MYLNYHGWQIITISGTPFWDPLMEPSILGSFFPGSGQDGEPGNGEEERCNKNDMNPVYFNHLACMCVLGDTFSYHL